MFGNANDLTNSCLAFDIEDDVQFAHRCVLLLKSP